MAALHSIRTQHQCRRVSIRRLFPVEAGSTRDSANLYWITTTRGRHRIPSIRFSSFCKKHIPQPRMQPGGTGQVWIAMMALPKPCGSKCPSTAAPAARGESVTMNPARITPGTASQQLLKSRLRDARARCDELFALLRPDALYERPIPERNRIIFYLGHFEAFDWNLICDGLFGMKSIHREFDRLFAFGIDPTNGNLPQDRPGDWPGAAEVRDYNVRVRQAVDFCLDRATEDQRFHVAIEHRLMHAETLTYMFHCLPISMLSRPPVCTEVDLRPVQPRSIQIPAGSATLGMLRHADSFGWDNEFDACDVKVPAFLIDVHKVTNDDYLKFVRAGGYQEKSLWTESGWQ